MKLEELISKHAAADDQATVLALLELAGHRAFVARVVGPRESERLRLQAQIALNGRTELLQPGKHLFVVPHNATHVRIVREYGMHIVIPIAVLRGNAMNHPYYFIGK